MLFIDDQCVNVHSFKKAQGGHKTQMSHRLAFTLYTLQRSSFLTLLSDLGFMA